MKTSYFFIAFCFIFLSCKKTETRIAEIKEQPWTVEIISINKVNINKLSVKVTITTDSSFKYDDYGVVYAKDHITSITQSGIQTSSNGSLTGQTVASGTCTIDSLQGDVIYYLKAYVKKGTEVFLSAEKTVSIEALKVLGIEPVRDGFYADRGELMSFKLNYIDKSSAIETKLSIGGVNISVTAEADHFIYFKVPDGLSTGKKSIQIERNGLKLFTSDTLDILPGKYSILSDFPYAFRSLYGVSQIGNDAYIIGGLENSNTFPNGWHKDVLKYDLTSGQWNSNLASYPNDFFVDGLSFPVNNKIYSFPGKDMLSGYNSNRMYEFNPSTNTWTGKAVFPGESRSRSSGFAINGKIYILGGQGMFSIFDLWEYDPATDIWTQKANFPGAAVLYPAIYTYNNKAMIFGGVNNNFVSGEFWEYDPALNEWKELPLLNTVKKRFRSFYFTIGNKGYLMGGADITFDAFGYYTIDVGDAWEIDLTNKQWKRISLNRASITYPPNFSQFYLQSAAFIKNGSAILYDRGKMIQFTPE
jgi:N-acetylneuraminic acid mutarotase